MTHEQLMKLSKGQLARMVQVLRRNAHTVAAAASLDYEADSIAAEPVELTDWEIVMGWLFAGSDRFLQIANDRKAFHLFADDAEGSFDSVQAFNGDPSPQLCVAQMAAWIRAQKEAGNV